MTSAPLCLHSHISLCILFCQRVPQNLLCTSTAYYDFTITNTKIQKHVISVSIVQHNLCTYKTRDYNIFI